MGDCKDKKIGEVMLVFYAPMNNLGYGVHSYNLIKEVYNLEYDEIALVPPFGNIQLNNELIDKWINNRKYIKKDSTGVMIFQEAFMHQFSGSPRIGLPVFEMKIIPPASLAALRSCDNLIVVSHWAKRILGNHGIDSSVVPEGHDPSIFYSKYPLQYKLDRIEKRGVTFCTVGKIEERKGTIDILRALKATTSKTQKKINLILHAYNSFDSAWSRIVGLELKKLGFSEITTQPSEIDLGTCICAKSGSLTVYIPANSFSSQNSIAKICRASDFGIWLSRAEGWNLPLMECIACGTPALTTSWTGMSEYITDKYPKELRIDDGVLVTANDGKWFRGDRGTWCIPDPDNVVSKLENMVYNPKEILELENQCVSCVKDFTWKNAAIKFVDTLKEIENERKSR